MIYMICTYYLKVLSNGFEGFNFEDFCLAAVGTYFNWIFILKFCQKSLHVCISMCLHMDVNMCVCMLACVHTYIYACVLRWLWCAAYSCLHVGWCYNASKIKFLLCIRNCTYICIMYITCYTINESVENTIPIHPLVAAVTLKVASSSSTHHSNT